MTTDRLAPRACRREPRVSDRLWWLLEIMHDLLTSADKAETAYNEALTRGSGRSDGALAAKAAMDATSTDAAPASALGAESIEPAADDRTARGSWLPPVVFALLWCWPLPA